MSEIASAGAHRATVAAQLDRAFVECWAARMLAVWNNHDTTDLPDLVTGDVVWIDPALAEPAHGLAGVRRFMEASWRAVPDLHFDPTGSPCYDDDAPVLMVPWRITGTHVGPVDPPGYAPTGRRIDVEGVDVYTFRGERVAHYRACYDNLAIARQLGILPAPGSRGERLLAAAQRLRARLRSRRG